MGVLRARLGLPPLPLLAAAAVKHDESYLLALRRFMEFIAQKPCSTIAELDLLSAECASHLALQVHLGQAAGNTLQAALLHFVPEAQRNLPLLGRSVKGWRRVRPGKQRSPLSTTCTGALAHWFCEQGEVEAACVTVLSFDGLLRDQDWSRLKGRDIAVQARTGEVALSLGVDEPTKTGYDQGVVLTRNVAKSIARALKAARADDSLVFQVTEGRFRELFAAAVGALALPLPENGLPWVPHCLRHGGASELHRTYGWPIADIKIRGRWTGPSDKSVQRYTKAHQLVSLDAALDGNVRARAAAFWSDPAACLGF